MYGNFPHIFLETLAVMVALVLALYFNLGAILLDQINKICTSLGTVMDRHLFQPHVFASTTSTRREIGRRRSSVVAGHVGSHLPHSFALSIVYFNLFYRVLCLLVWWCYSGACGDAFVCVANSHFVSSGTRLHMFSETLFLHDATLSLYRKLAKAR